MSQMSKLRYSIFNMRTVRPVAENPLLEEFAFAHPLHDSQAIPS